MKKLCIFDYDGTLINSIEDIAISFNEALLEHGLPTKTLDEYKLAVGGNLETVVSNVLCENSTKENIEKVKKTYQKIYFEGDKPNTKPYAKIAELLSELQNRNILLGISSNKKLQPIIDLNRKFFPEIDFFDIKAYFPSKPFKPDPTEVLNMIEKAGISKEESIYIGDSGTDIKTAENADIDCVLVDWGQAKPGDFKNKYVSGIISDPFELFDYLGE